MLHLVHKNNIKAQLMSNNEIISRLIKYKNALTKLRSLGIVKVFSDNLGDTAGVTASQVRKDFSTLNIKGNKRGGYNITELLNNTTDILGDEQGQKIIVVGCGNIGMALMNHNRFGGDQMKIVAGFDSNIEKVDNSANIPILQMDKLKSFVLKNNIKVGIIAVPEPVANEIYNAMKEAGIKGFLNFTHVNLREEETIVNNIDIELEVENIFYKINFMEKENKL